MRILILVIASVVQLASGAARAESLEATQKRVEQLESEVRELRARIANLGPVAGAREIRAANPVFLGEESMGPSSVGYGRSGDQLSGAIFRRGYSNLEDRQYCHSDPLCLSRSEVANWSPPG